MNRLYLLFISILSLCLVISCTTDLQDGATTLVHPETQTTGYTTYRFENSTENSVVIIEFVCPDGTDQTSNLWICYNSTCGSSDRLKILDCNQRVEWEYSDRQSKPEYFMQVHGSSTDDDLYLWATSADRLYQNQNVVFTLEDDGYYYYIHFFCTSLLNSDVTLSVDVEDIDILASWSNTRPLTTDSDLDFSATSPDTLTISRTDIDNALSDGYGMLHLALHNSSGAAVPTGNFSMSVDNLTLADGVQSLRSVAKYPTCLSTVNFTLDPTGSDAIALAASTETVAEDQIYILGGLTEPLQLTDNQMFGSTDVQAYSIPLAMATGTLIIGVGPQSTSPPDPHIDVTLANDIANGLVKMDVMHLFSAPMFMPKDVSFPTATDQEEQFHVVATQQMTLAQPNVHTTATMSLYGDEYGARYATPFNHSPVILSNNVSMDYQFGFRASHTGNETLNICSSQPSTLNDSVLLQCGAAASPTGRDLVLPTTYAARGTVIYTSVELSDASDATFDIDMLSGPIYNITTDYLDSELSSTNYDTFQLRMSVPVTADNALEGFTLYVDDIISSGATINVCIGVNATGTTTFSPMIECSDAGLMISTSLTDSSLTLPITQAAGLTAGTMYIVIDNVTSTMTMLNFQLTSSATPTQSIKDGTN
ncbi:hypothetical protein ADUPG1_006182, partial [Aduncisulcus paluster]